jgi:glycosyltransferase involved in cell wall biosynthesis
MIHVSILTTVYNGWEFLEECAASIYSQNCAYNDIQVEWEWLIGINGHGDDGGPALLTAARVATGPHTRVKNLTHVNGRVEALEALRIHCSPKSEWIAILDCDDIWMPDKLITQAAAILQSKNTADVIGTFCEYFGDRDGTPQLPGGWITREQIEAANPIINSSALIRTHLARWEDRFGLEDYDLWLRLIKDGRRFFNVPFPLVKHRIHASSAFNGRGTQDLEGLRRFHRRATVVSAYYPIESKNSVESYIDWIREFWPRMQCALVFYTEPALVPLFQQMFAGKDAVVVGLPLSSLNAFQKIEFSTWAATHSLDTEKEHTPELYALWFEKKEFVLRTIETNPFYSSTFVWCDAGIGRFPQWIPLIQGFPDSRRIPSGKMLVLQIDPFNQEDHIASADGIRGSFGTRPTVGGGILASDKEGWIAWSKEYDAMLLNYIRAGRFIGKDQNIMGSMILDNPGCAQLISRPPSLGPIGGWFYLLFYLAGLQIS